MKQNSISQLLVYGKQLLKDNGIESYSLDSRLLLMEAAGLSATDIITDGEQTLCEGRQQRFLNLLKMRKEHMPVAYILNRCEFMSLPFYVDENVLIPRGDTEILVEHAIELIKTNKYEKILEIGTGSGCISVSLANYLDNIEITACDISEKAIEIANKNALNNNVANKIYFIRSDLFSNISEKFDLIISNPPYITENEMAELPKSVSGFEPHLALYGGIDGLKFYKDILENSKNYLNHNASVAFEIGCFQSDDVKNLMKLNNFRNIEIINDLSGLNRVVSCKFEGIEKSV